MRPYIPWIRKGLIAIAGAIAVLTFALSDGHVTGQEWLQAASAALAAVGVVVVPNGPKPDGDGS